MDLNPSQPMLTVAPRPVPTGDLFHLDVPQGSRPDESSAATVLSPSLPDEVLLSSRPSTVLAQLSTAGEGPPLPDGLTQPEPPKPAVSAALDRPRAFDPYRDTALRYLGLVNETTNGLGPVVQTAGRYLGNVVAVGYAASDTVSKAIRGYKSGDETTDPQTRLKNGAVAAVDAGFFQGMGSVWGPAAIVSLEYSLVDSLLKGAASRKAGFVPATLDTLLAKENSGLLGQKLLRGISTTLKPLEQTWQKLPKPLRLDWLMHVPDAQESKGVMKALFNGATSIGSQLGRIPGIKQLAANPNVQVFVPMALAIGSIPLLVKIIDPLLEKTLDHTWRKWFGDPAGVSKHHKTT